MKNQPIIYYTISGVMIAIGFLMLTDIFSLTTAQMNVINIGAALITLSTALVGVFTFKGANKKIKGFSTFNFFVGIIIIFFGFLIRGFKEDIELVVFFESMDSNPLVLVCLGITIGSIVLLNDYNRKKLHSEKEELNKKIKKLELENKQLEKEIVRASAFLEGLKGSRNE